ncbi:MAG: methyltransferase domain-containing protein [Nitrosopumilus sp.]|nr:methyltransferase domain-containing protein [Nitrosopumilus sp.]
MLALTDIFELFLSTFRRNERDVINLYNTLSRLMQITTGGNMLNFGYWNNNTQNPLQAQNTLSTMIGEFASLQSARTLIDVGSGYSAPAFQWISQYSSLKILCINTNLPQLKIAVEIKSNNQRIDNNNELSLLETSRNNEIIHINATSTMIPVKNNSVDRIIAFESAQHFKPLIQFIQESNRLLKRSGILVIAIPVIINSSNSLSLPLFVKLGILSVTWASEHYNVEYVKSMIKTNGFQIEDIRYIGSNVYEPLASYYIKNREKLKKRIVKEYPKFLESILYRSLLEMNTASRKGVIDYVLLKATKI